MLRYIKRLESRDLSLTASMIPLGSCTMKLNAAAEMFPVSWPEFAKIHPFAPLGQTRGYQTCFSSSKTGSRKSPGSPAFRCSPTPVSQGEYTGLLVIRAYHESRNEPHRNVCLIPTSAHGTNPASAVMAGLKVVAVACDQDGNIDVADLRAKAEAHKQRPRVPDGHLSVHARRVRGNHPGDLRNRPRQRRAGLHGRREHERAGRP